MQPQPLPKIFRGELSRFRQIWLSLCEIWAKLSRNLGKIEAKFGQNQNLASTKTFDGYGLGQM